MILLELLKFHSPPLIANKTYYYHHYYFSSFSGYGSRWGKGQENLQKTLNFATVSYFDVSLTETYIIKVCNILDSLIYYSILIFEEISTYPAQRLFYHTLHTR